ncbi:MAG: hypothetical protein AAFN68_13695, partial [Pseudomonadota bacterium]
MLSELLLIRTFVFSLTVSGTDNVGAAWPMTGVKTDVLNDTDLTGTAQARRAAIVSAEAVWRLT